MFKNKHLITWCLLILLAVVAGCKSKFEKLVQSNDTGKKYQEAIRLYNKKDYSKALILFDGLMQKYRGRSEAEDLSYYFAYTNYQLKDYTTARYQFKVFADTYPNSARAEDCRFMSAYCYYLESPNFSLDQENTARAIESLQLFINLYPKSDRVAEASNLIANLRDKLERKAFANAKLYLDIGAYDVQNYRSAVYAFKNVLRDYPDTKYAEEMEYLSVQAQYLYAENSIEIRQEERYEEVVSLATEFAEDYPGSKYLKEVQNYKKKAEEGISQVQKLLAAQQQPAPKSKETEKNKETDQENKTSKNE
ncbi:outer membrane protein assembly factor BamD [Arcticibacter tournemirensis]|uniref:Outer membrane protein assembly factor BamD n=1 Tax=Arcticibacter tournemirensis TaxID=699437 RepID=A0A4Q0M8N3_9SPHI|nr:outer membrane protein assembly factor BamD [Arcticibacter tournemirensis]RXF69283.1 outer membrane protein assembly factor BamD [Arcticibacter tournemirensis]